MLADLSPQQIVNRLLLRVLRNSDVKVYSDSAIAAVVGATSRAILGAGVLADGDPGVFAAMLATTVPQDPAVEGLPEDCVVTIFRATLDAWAEVCS